MYDITKISIRFALTKKKKFTFFKALILTCFVHN